MNKCKAKVTTGFIGGLRNCKRKVSSGSYCYQHQFLATQTPETIVGGTE